MNNQKALDALDRIFNYCEEIDWHIPEEERSGYKMLPDIFIIKDYINSLQDILAEAEMLHPYKVYGKHETYSQYNEGWCDALHYIDARITKGK